MIKGALEENVLTLLCWHEEHAPMLAMRLQPALFSTRAYRDIAEKAIEHIGRYSVPPRGHLKDILESNLRKGDEGKLLWATLEAMETLQSEMQPQYVLGELDKFISLRQMAQAIEAASDAIHSGDLEAAREAIYAQQQPHHNASPGIFLSNPKSALSFLDEREDDNFSMGIDVLDDKHIKPERKTLTLLIAPPKRGKTWYLINAGKHNILQRKKVLHVTLENGEEKTTRRYVQSLFAMSQHEAGSIRVPIFKRNSAGQCEGIDFDTLSPEALNSEARLSVARKLRKLRASLLIKEFPSGTLTLPQLEAYLDWLKKAHDFEPDMLLLDYPDLMAMNADRVRIDTGRIFVGLRGLAGKRNMAVVAVTQGNRFSSSAKTVGANQVAEDYSKVATADTVLTYSQTPEERSLGLARILIAAGRNAEDQFSCLISQSYVTGQFCLDSVYMEKTMAAEISRLTGSGDEEE